MLENAAESKLFEKKPAVSFQPNTSSSLLSDTATEALQLAFWTSPPWNSLSVH